MLNCLTPLIRSSHYRKCWNNCTLVQPVFINYICTFRCSSRCTMCKIWSLYKTPKGKEQRGQELSAGQLQSILRRDREFLSRVRHVGITGGDPLMRSDIVDLVRVFRQELPGAATGIQTNGLVPRLLERRIREILKFYPEFSLAVSLDGIGEAHDRIRGIHRAFERAVESIRIAKSLGIKRITTGMTVSNANVDQISKVKELSEELGTEFSCLAAEESNYFQNQGIHVELTPENRNLLIAYLEKYGAYHYYMDGLRHRLQSGHKRRLRCYSGQTSLVWDPYGNVKICILRSDSFGNLNDRPLQEMLTAPLGVQLRESVKKCDCWCQCEVSSSAVIDPWDVVRWWVFDCREKKQFLHHMARKAS